MGTSTGSRRPTALPLAVTLGDPAGIGPEIILKAWLDRRQRALAPFVVIGSAEVLAATARALGLPVHVARVDRVREAADGGEAIAAVDVPLAAAVRPGVPDPANGQAVARAIDMAVEAVRRGEAAAVVTAPIAKRVLHLAGFRYPGHTERLAELAALHWPGAHCEPVMMLVGGGLRVVPLTIHIPLRDVAGAVSEEGIVAVARITAEALARDFAVPRPRIAIAGLNPHAGEDGSIGSEDRDIIRPAIVRLAAEGLAVSGPHPADTLFHEAARQRYDAAIAMYHDQALIPLKTIAFEDGVNVTLGLPFVRTSPDHGTAFDIAGQGRASPRSLIAALDLADQMAARRAGQGP
jgi:4-hydroxythreonine-4-phosphate dehydrogenase